MYAPARGAAPARLTLELLEDRAVPADLSPTSTIGNAADLTTNVTAVRGGDVTLIQQDATTPPPGLLPAGVQAIDLAAQADLGNVTLSLPNASALGAVTSREGVVVSGPAVYVLSSLNEEQARNFPLNGQATNSLPSVTFRPEQAAVGFQGRLLFPGTGVLNRVVTGDGPLNQPPGVFLVGGSRLPFPADSPEAPPWRLATADEGEYRDADVDAAVVAGDTTEPEGSTPDEAQEELPPPAEAPVP